MNNMIYTPIKHIPIGQAVQTEGGAVLKIKKANSSVTESITVEEFIRLIIRSTEI